MSCSSKHKIAVQGVLGCMILLLGFWHIRYSYANKLNNKACTMADSEKAMRTIEKAIKLNPMNPVYYANMGLLYAATDTAINLRNYMALSKVSSEALDKSLAYFHLANNMAPKNRLFSLNLGLLYALNGKYLKAKSFFEKAVEVSGKGTASFGAAKEHWKDIFFEKNEEVPDEVRLFAQYDDGSHHIVICGWNGTYEELETLMESVSAPLYVMYKERDDGKL